VAVTSLSLDLSKRKIYASAGIPEAEVVDENGKIVARLEKELYIRRK
jgi:hypothetical protein